MTWPEWKTNVFALQFRIHPKRLPYPFMVSDILEQRQQRSLCVTCFSFPFAWCVFWLFPSHFPGFVQSFFRFSILFVNTPKVIWRCVSPNICLVDSILCFPFLFPLPRSTKQHFLARQFCNTKKAAYNRKEKYANCSDTQKKRKKFCHVVLLFLCFLIMEQNAEIPFAKAISKYSDNVGHFEGCKLARGETNLKCFHGEFCFLLTKKELIKSSRLNALNERFWR